MQNTNPTYFVRTEREFKTIMETIEYKNHIDEITELQISLKIGYYLPQRVFKSWVPNWLIKLISL